MRITICSWPAIFSEVRGGMMKLAWSRLLFILAAMLSLQRGVLVYSYKIPDVYFNCPQLPPLAQPAKTVHELRPQDIKVVMALGDSVTAGFGIMGAKGKLEEYRGQSWSIGMDKGAQTLANFLKLYNPSLIGGSLGHHFVEICSGIFCFPFQYHLSKDVFNAAQSGALASNLVPHQFNYLLKQLKSHPGVDMENDWKLMTIFIGANDACFGCSGDVFTLTGEDFERHVRDVLKELRKSIPKLFVNLVLLGNVTEIYRTSLQSDHCSNIHRVFPFECVCAFTSGKLGEKLREDMASYIADINNRQRNVVAEYAEKNYTDFAVVVQPFLSNKIFNYPIEFLSDLDCFHPSLIAHQNMAKSLWNNMITPATLKKDYFDYTEPFICPSSEIFLYTT